MTDRPRLYPGHQHQWAETDPRLTDYFDLVTCTVCGFQAPRSLANLDGAMLNDAVYDGPETDQGAAT